MIYLISALIFFAVGSADATTTTVVIYAGATKKDCPVCHSPVMYDCIYKIKKQGWEIEYRFVKLNPVSYRYEGLPEQFQNTVPTFIVYKDKVWRGTISGVNFKEIYKAGNRR